MYYLLSYVTGRGGEATHCKRHVLAAETLACVTTSEQMRVQSLDAISLRVCACLSEAIT